MTLSIKDALKIDTVPALEAAFVKFDDELCAELEPLFEAIGTNLLGADSGRLAHQLWLVSSYQGKLVEYMSLSSAFYDHARGASFLLAKNKDTTALDREAYQRKLGAGWNGWCVRLEGLFKVSESRINLIKKLMGLENGASNHA